MFDLAQSTNDTIQNIATKIKQIEKESPSEETPAKYIEELIFNNRKITELQKTENKLIESGFNKMSIQIKKLQESWESDTEEGGLSKPETELLSWMKKMTGIIGRNGNISNPIITSLPEKPEESGWLSKILMTGGLLAGLATLWGYIKDNPEVKKLISEFGNFVKGVWNDTVWPNLQPILKDIWEKFKAGAKSLFGGLMELLGPEGQLALGIGAVGAALLALTAIGGGLSSLGVLLSPTGLILTGLAALGYSLVKFDTAINGLADTTMSFWEDTKKWNAEINFLAQKRKFGTEYEKQASITGENTEKAGKAIIKETLSESIGPEWLESSVSPGFSAIRTLFNSKAKNEKIKAQKQADDAREAMHHISLQEAKFRALAREYGIYVQTRNEAIKIAKETGPNAPKDLTKILEASEKVNDNDFDVEIIDGKHYFILKSNRQNAEDWNIQMPKPIKKPNNIPIISEPVSKIKEGNLLHEKTNLTNTKLAEINSNIIELKNAIKENTEVNVEGHTINAKATLSSVPPPPVINIAPPTPTNGPNSTRRLANIFTDPEYTMTNK